MKSIIKIFGAIAILAVAVGFSFYQGTLFTSKKSDGFSSGWAAAEKKLQETGVLPSNLYSLSGKVEKVQGNEIYFKADLKNPLLPEELKTRIAIVGEATPITLYKNKDRELTFEERRDAEQERADLNLKKKDLVEKAPDCFAGVDLQKDPVEKCVKSVAEMAALEKVEIALNIKLNRYDVVNLKDLLQIKPGMLISVTSVSVGNAPLVGEKVETTPTDKMDNSGSTVAKIDISQEKRFKVESVELRDETSMAIEKKLETPSGMTETDPGKFEAAR